MENTKIILFSVLIGLVLLAIIGALLLGRGGLEGSPGESLEICNTIEYSGEGGTNLVFFADRKSAERYTNFFLEFAPFDENRGGV